MRLSDFRRLPRDMASPLWEWGSSTPAPSYFHYCANETIHGVEFHYTPQPPEDKHMSLVADMSSNFCSKPIEVEKHAIIYAGAQKNLGAAGCTIVVGSDTFLEGVPLRGCPTMCRYSTHVKHDSMYNTPPTFSIYVVGEMVKMLRETGGLASWKEKSEAKAKMVYDAIKESDGFFECPVEEHARSNMNVVFTLNLEAETNKDEPIGTEEDGGEAERGAGRKKTDTARSKKEKTEQIEKLFLAQAKQRHSIVGLGGHRSVGGFRASLYTGMSLAGVQSLVEFMKEFRCEYVADEC
eukprot:GHVT01076242.1.p1 GENE.GHVT01076242.1~~GHVT01076242.1.p1  ORF type:complete len:294 (-),score=44.12 GHVT01076242.1:409-1290(-)